MRVPARHSRCHRKLLGSIVLLVLAAGSLVWWSSTRVMTDEVPEATRDTPTRDADPAEELLTNTAGIFTPRRDLPVRQQILEATEPPGPNDLVVQVLDHRSRPLAGFWLILAPSLLPSDHASADLRDVESLVRQTNSVGLVVFPDQRRALRGYDAPWFLIHKVCFAQRPHRKLDAAALACDVVVTVQPPFGSIELVPVELDGQPAKNTLGAQLGIIDPGESEDPTLAWQRKSFDGEVNNAIAWFPYVELGQSFVGGVYRDSEDVPSTGEAAGPVRSGQVVRIPIKMGLSHPIAEFRAVDENGLPIVETRLQLSVLPALAFYSNLRFEIRTDGQGRFQIGIKASLNVLGPDLLNIIEKRDGKDFRSGAVKIPGRLKLGPNNCGDVILHKRTPLITGWARDAAGAPIAGLNIRAGERISFEGTVGPLLWRILDNPHNANGETDLRGYFEIYGEIPNDTFKVWADGDNIRSEAIEVSRGDRDKHLACYRVFAPIVEVLINPACKWDGGSIELREPGTDKAGVGAAQTQEMGVGQVLVTMKPVRGGHYDLIWAFRGTRLGIRANVQFTPDSVIETIDLRNSLYPFSIQLDRPGTAPDAAIDGTLRWRSGTDSRWQNIGFKKTRIEFCSASPTVDIRILTERYCVESLRSVHGTRTVILRKGVRVRLILKTDGKLPKHPYIFDPYPEVDGKAIGKAIGSRYFTEQKRESTFILPIGEVVIGWHMERRIENGAIGGGVLRNHSVKIQVMPSAQNQVFTLDLDGKALDRLVKQPPW